MLWDLLLPISAITFIVSLHRQTALKLHVPTTYVGDHRYTRMVDNCYTLHWLINDVFPIKFCQLFHIQLIFPEACIMLIFMLHFKAFIPQKATYLGHFRLINYSNLNFFIPSCFKIWRECIIIFLVRATIILWDLDYDPMNPFDMRTPIQIWNPFHFLHSKYARVFVLY